MEGKRYFELVDDTSRVLLDINSANLTAGMCDAILNGKILPQLETQELSGGTLPDPSAQARIKGNKNLTHLKERNRLSKEAQTSFNAQLPNPKVGTQRSEGQPEFFFRSVATLA